MTKWIPELGRELSDRLLHIWEGTSDLPTSTEEAYRDLFRKQAGKEMKRSKCRHLGADTGSRVECSTCPETSNARFKLFVCESPNTGGRCTIEPAANDVDNCLHCRFWEAPLPVKKASTADVLQVTDLVKKLRYGFEDLFSLPHDVVRDAHIRLLEEAKEKPPPVETGTGRGIVMGVGGTLYFQCAWVATSVLRGLGCTLPVEWWYLGSSEMDSRMAVIAAELGVVCRDATAVVQDLPPNRRPRILNGWELKPFAVAHSSFQEVLFLDADNICVKDPTFLFDHPLYLKYGAAFWPDLDPYDRREWVPETAWRNVGLERREEVDFESGQFLIHKGRRSRELGVTVHINDHSDWYYKFVYGDKTTYHLAWRVCGSDYAIPSTGAGWVWPAIQQYDFDGNLLFQHVCQGKELLVSGRTPNLKSSYAATSASKRLADIWHGKIWSALDCDPVEVQLMREAAGSYSYKRLGIEGEPTRTLELRPDGTIGEGAAACERAWCVRLIDRVPTLVITGSAHKNTQIAMMFLTEGEDGIWRGRWQAHERGPVELRRL